MKVISTYGTGTIMDSEPKHTTVLITGASRGLGASLAFAFANAGARVSICGRAPAALAPVCERIERAGGECIARGVDIRNELQVERWVAETTERWGAPDVLINNASLLGPRLPLPDFPVEDWREVLEVNLNGTFLVCRAVVKAMLHEGRGSIINVSSGAAIPPRRGWGAYAVSKHALEGFSRNLAAELQDSGIRVNIVDPGAMRTDMRAAAYPDEDPGTLKEPDAVAPLFLWLAGKESRDTTGHRFQADEWLRAYT